MEMKTHVDISSQNSQNANVTYEQALDTAIKNETSFINDMEFLNVLLNHPGLKGNVLSLDKCILNVSNLLTAHRHLRDEFSDKTCLVSCAFFNFMPHLKIYIDYVCCVERVNTCIQKITTPCIGKLWKQSSELLLSPVKHLAKYKEIIDDFRNSLPEQESKPLKDILEAIQKSLVQVRALCGTTENALKLHRIQKSICEGQVKIFAPGRRFLKEDCLLKVNKKNGYQQRVVFLFSDILLCCKKVRQSQDWHKKSSLSFDSIIPLHLCTIHSVWKTYDGHNAFEIRWETNSYKLFSRVDGVTQSWVEEIEQAIGYCKEILRVQEQRNKCCSLRRNTLLRRTSQPMLQKRHSESNLQQNSARATESSLLQSKSKKKLSLKQSFRALFH